MFGCLGHATSREVTVDPVEIEDAIWVSREAHGGDPAGRGQRDPAAALRRHRRVPSADVGCGQVAVTR